MALEMETVFLTGLPVSDELQSILDRCEQGEDVLTEEVMNTPEMITASSCVSHQTPTIQLKDREQIEAHIFNTLNKYGSVSMGEKGDTLVDRHGNTVYNGDVEQGSRLDIVIGLPASGKSSAIVDTISYEHKAMLIDNDEAKRLFPEFNKGWGADVVHLESQMVEREVFKAAVKRHDNIVMPKVGSDADKLIIDYLRIARKEGYKINVHFVDLDKNKTMGRMLRRFIHKGRYLSPRLIDKYVNEREGNRIAKAYEELKVSGMVDGFSKWNNDVGIGEKPILLESIGLDDKFIKEARVTDKTVMENGGKSNERDGEEHSKDGSFKSDELRGRADSGKSREDNGRSKQGGRGEGSGDRGNVRAGGISAQYEDISRGSRPEAVNHQNEREGGNGDFDNVTDYDEIIRPEDFKKEHELLTNKQLFDQGIESIYEGQNPEGFKEQIIATMTGRTLAGREIPGVQEGGFSFGRSFDYIVQTYKDNKEAYADIGADTEVTTVYGSMKLDSITQDNHGRFNLQDYQYTGILSEDNFGLKAGTILAFTAAEVLAVRVKADDMEIYENTSKMNPDFEALSKRVFEKEEPKTFRGYVENEKAAFDVTFFKNDGKDVFYIEDTGEYPLMMGEGTLERYFNYTPAHALECLNMFGENFGGSKDFVVFDILEPERTAQEIDRALSAESLPVEFTVNVKVNDWKEKEANFYFAEERDAKYFVRDYKEHLEADADLTRDHIEVVTDIHTRPEITEKMELEADHYVPGPETIKFREKTAELFHELNGENPESIEGYVKDKVQEVLDFYEVNATVVDAVVAGSRARGIEREDSDIDVVVQIDTTEREDSLFNTIADEGLMIGTTKLDINPITKQESGTLEDYLPKQEVYLAEKAEREAQQTQETETVDKGAELHTMSQAAKNAVDKDIKSDKDSVEEENREVKAQNAAEEAKAKQREEERKAQEADRSKTKYANFVLAKSEGETPAFIIIADAKHEDGRFEAHKPIAEFPDKKSAMDFISKNNLKVKDTTRDLQNMIRDKKIISSKTKDQGAKSQNPNRGGGGIGDE